MKIRIKGNSIRIRVTRSELDYFALHGTLEETTDFGPSQLKYVLNASDEHDALAADFSEGTISMHVPRNLAQEWASTERVGIAYFMETGKKDRLHLLLEKDFKCLDNVAEDQSDMFPNPAANKHE